MRTTDRKRNPRFLRLAGILLASAGVLVFGAILIRHRAILNLEQSKQERVQREFAAVKAGDSNALVLDSKLLPMFANDADCKRIITSLDFAFTEIDETDAAAVSMLRNLGSITFYCNTGTEAVLTAAKNLPITYLFFEMDDLPPESYLILNQFPSLESVHFQHVMDADWISRLESELPGVTILTSFPE